MIVEGYNSRGRVDLFGIDGMTGGMPLSGNLPKNYEFGLSYANSESLWLCSYYYDTAQACKGVWA